MKKTFLPFMSGLLLVCMWLHTTGLYIVFHLYKMDIRREMKLYVSRHLQNARVTRFSFSPHEQQDLEWENEDEFSYRGKMYDVIRKEQKGNTTIIYCIQDKKETALVQDFLKHTKRQFPVKGKTAPLRQLLGWHAILVEKTMVAILPVSSVLHYTHLHCLLPSTYADILKPPPRQVA